MSETVIKKSDRRNFLRGSALFAAAIGMAAVPGLSAQEKPKPPKPEEETEDPKPADPLAGDKSKDGKLCDKEGREYKVCPQCGYNLYKQGRMWIYENCGYSYVE